MEDGGAPGRDPRRRRATARRSDASGASLEGTNMKKALTLIAVTAVGLGTMNAWAVDNREIPAMLCQKIDGNGTPVVGWQGSVSNTSTTDTLRMSCPIIRDNWNAPPFWIGVTAVDANPTTPDSISTDVCCQFYSTDTLSTNVFWGNAQNCTVGSQTPNALGLSLSSAFSFTNGTEMLFCSVPPVQAGHISSLLSYAVSE
jgi:hypothetical protein